jgi:tetrahydromethanopterin S-methyltransferase subunit G
VLTGVGEMIEQNIFPKFDEMDARFEKIDARFESLETKVEALPTKHFVYNLVTEQIGNLEGQMNTRFREQSGRFDNLIDTLHGRKVLEPADSVRLKTPKILPGPAS